LPLSEEQAEAWASAAPEERAEASALPLLEELVWTVHQELAEASAWPVSAARAAAAHRMPPSAQVAAPASAVSAELAEVSASAVSAARPAVARRVRARSSSGARVHSLEGSLSLSPSRSPGRTGRIPAPAPAGALSRACPVGADRQPIRPSSLARVAPQPCLAAPRESWPQGRPAGQMVAQGRYSAVSGPFGPVERLPAPSLPFQLLPRGAGTTNPAAVRREFRSRPVPAGSIHPAV